MNRWFGMTIWLGIGLGWFVFSDPLAAWSFDGHRAVTSAALDLVAPSVPLDRDASEWAVEGAVFPDLTRPSSLSMLAEYESPRHYVNLERLGGRELPADRAAYAALLARLSREQEEGTRVDMSLRSVGSLPYVVVESTQRLATVFRQLRSSPGEPRLGRLALHYAGVLTHFTADLCQPLHTSIDHDGRVGSRGRSPRSGLHDLVDRLFDRVPVSADVVPLTSAALGPETELFELVVAELDRSHAEVDRVYQLETDIRDLYAGGEVTPGLQDFVDERFAAAARFSARLLDLAWRLSASIELP